MTNFYKGYGFQKWNLIPNPWIASKNPFPQKQSHLLIPRKSCRILKESYKKKYGFHLIYLKNYVQFLTILSVDFIKSSMGNHKSLTTARHGNSFVQITKEDLRNYWGFLGDF